MTAGAAGRVEAQVWTVDVAASRAEFRARDLLHRPVVGTLPVLSGRVRTVDGRTTVGADLDLTGVSTGNDRRDRDLRGPHFLDAGTSPVLRFDGGPGEQCSDGTWRLPGELTLKGGSCAVVVDAVLSADDGVLRVRATTSLDRRDAGIRVPRVLVGTHVDVVVDAVLLPESD